MAATGPAGALPPPTLAHLVWGWGSAYAIGYGQDQWRAARRDGRAVLAAHTLAGLAAAIEADYRHRPVPREFDPPGIAPGDDDAPGDDEPFLLAALQAAFPAWAITYDPGTRTWTARTRRKTICQNSAVLLCAAMVLIERRYRQYTGGPGPGPGPGPG